MLTGRSESGDQWRSAYFLLFLGEALHKGLAALHLVGQRCLVDLDHDSLRVDAEVFHQRLRDVAHHAGLLLVGAAGGHAYGDLRHSGFSLCVLEMAVAAIDDRTYQTRRGSTAQVRGSRLK